MALSFLAFWTNPSFGLSQRPGRIYSNWLFKSDRRFSTGVPDKATRMEPTCSATSFLSGLCHVTPFWVWCWKSVVVVCFWMKLSINQYSIGLVDEKVLQEHHGFYCKLFYLYTPRLGRSLRMEIRLRGLDLTEPTCRSIRATQPCWSVCCSSWSAGPPWIQTPKS